MRKRRAKTYWERFRSIISHLSRPDYEPVQPRGVTGRISNQPSVMAGYLDLQVEHGGALRRTWRSPGRHCVSFCVVTVLSDRCITAAVELQYTGPGEACLGVLDVRETIARSVS